MREGVIFSGCLALSTALHAAAIAGLVPSEVNSNGFSVIEVSIHATDEISLPGQTAASATTLSRSLSALVEPALTPLKSVRIVERSKPNTAKVAAPPPVSPEHNSASQEKSTGTAGAGYQALLGAGAGSSSGMVQVIFAPRPPYPWAARVAGFEGALTLDIVIGEDGYVKSANIVESSGREDCDKAALSTIRDRWRFRPIEREGLAVECKERVVVRYALK